MINSEFENYPNIEKTITEGQRKAEAYLKQAGFNAEQVAHLRIKTKKDLFFCCYSVLGYDKLSPHLHGDFCDWHKDTERELYRLGLLPRSHYKTTIGTIGDTIQTALPDDLGDSAYPRNLGTDLRLLLAHEKHESASRFLFSITQHFTSNPVLTALFPECVPNPRIHRINRYELELPRKSIWSEPTIDTMGVGGKNQGRHYNKIKCDDIYGAEARDSKAERESTILWFDNVPSYFITPATDQLDVYGTRWAFDDIYAHYLSVYKILGINPAGRDYLQVQSFLPATGEEGQLSVYKRAAIESGVPIFPEQFTLKSFQILKKNPKVWNAQYANDPREGAAKFKSEWIRYYNKSGRDIVVINYDGPEHISFDSLDRIILIDPAITGLTGIAVTGTDKKNRVFVLESTKRVFKTEELLAYLFSLVIKYRPRTVVVEEVVFSALYEPLIQREMSLRNLRFRIDMEKVGKVEKEVRVDGLANYFAASQIFFSMDQKDLIEEFHQYGATDNYHILDALAMGRKYWRAGVNQRLIDQYRQAEETLQIGMDQITGYSRIRA